jgi:hypothetical protein
MIRKNNVVTNEARITMKSIYKGQALAAFVNGLKSSLRIAVVASRSKDLSEAVGVAVTTAATTVETVEQEELYNYGASGYNNYYPPRDVRPGRGRSGQTVEYRPVTCFKCGVMGNIARNCYSRQTNNNNILFINHIFAVAITNLININIICQISIS